MQPTAIKATFTGFSYEQPRTSRAPSLAKGKFDDVKCHSGRIVRSGPAKRHAKIDHASQRRRPPKKPRLAALSNQPWLDWAAPSLLQRRLRAAPFVLANNMASHRSPKTAKPLLTMHDWEAKHYVLAAVIIVVVMGMFAYSWS